MPVTGAILPDCSSSKSSSVSSTCESSSPINTGSSSVFGSGCHLVNRYDYDKKIS